MKTSQDQQTGLVSSTPFEDWASLLILLQKLQTRLSEDRQSWAATGGDMAYLVEALRMELQKLQALESDVDQKIKMGCQKAIQDQVIAMSRHLTAAVSTAFDNTIQRLDQVAQQAINQLRSFQIYNRQFKGWGLGLIFILCVLSSISGGCIVYLLHPQDQLSAEQWQLIQDGSILRKAWPNLSKTEQDKIITLFRGENTKTNLLHKNMKNP